MGISSCCLFFGKFILWLGFNKYGSEAELMMFCLRMRRRSSARTTSCGEVCRSCSPWTTGSTSISTWWPVRRFRGNLGAGGYRGGEGQGEVSWSPWTTGSTSISTWWRVGHVGAGCTGREKVRRGAGGPWKWVSPDFIVPQQRSPLLCLHHGPK